MIFFDLIELLLQNISIFPVILYCILNMEIFILYQVWIPKMTDIEDLRNLYSISGKKRNTLSNR